MSEALVALVSRLRAAGVDPAPHQVADALWLSRWARPAPAPTSGLLPPGPSPEDGPAERDEGDPARREEPAHRSAADGAASAGSDTPLSAVGPRRGQAPAEEAGRGPGLPVRVPAATALPDLLSLQRALRPLKRYRPPAHAPEAEIDEQATAEGAAATGYVSPVRQRSKRGDARVRLLMDVSSSMAPWEQMLDELRQVCEGTGAFRQVLVGYVHEDESGPVLSSSARKKASRLSPGGRSADPTGRQITVLLSDCAGPLWRSGLLQQAVHAWSRSGPVAVMQPLPQRMWRRTHLPALPGRLRRREGLRAEVDFQPAGGRTRGGQDRTARPVPVLAPTAAALDAWGRLLATRSGVSVNAAAAWVHPAHPAASAPRPSRPASATDLYRGFCGSASADAVQLAAMLSAAPLTLPVMQLVQRAMAPRSTPSVLAEVLLSGLLTRVADEPSPPGRTAAGPWYEFRSGVRELLLERLSVGDAALVLKECSRYVEAHFGRRARNFPAMAAAYLAGSARIPAGDRGAEAGGTPETRVPQPFAVVPRQVLRRFLAPTVGTAAAGGPEQRTAGPVGPFSPEARARHHLVLYRRDASVRDLDEAVRLLHAAVRAEAPAPERAARLHQLAEALMVRWQALRGHTDLLDACGAAERAVSTAEEATGGDAAVADAARRTLAEALAAAATEVQDADDWSALLPHRFRGGAEPGTRQEAVVALYTTAEDLYTRLLQDAPQRAEKVPNPALVDAAAQCGAVAVALTTAEEQQRREAGEDPPAADVEARRAALGRAAQALERLPAASGADRGRLWLGIGRLWAVQARLSTGERRQECAARGAGALLTAVGNGGGEPGDPHTGPDAWFDLAAMLRLTVTGDDPADVREPVLQAVREAAAHAVHTEQHPRALAMLAEVHLEHFRHHHDHAALEQAIQALEELRDSVPPEDTTYAVHLTSLGTALLERCRVRPEDADITHAVKVLREAVAETTDEGRLAERRILLGHALLQRFALRGRRTDRAEADWIFTSAAHDAPDARTAAQAALGLAAAVGASAGELPPEQATSTGRHLRRAAEAAREAGETALAAELRSVHASLLERVVGPRHALRLHREAWDLWREAGAEQSEAARATLRRLRELETSEET